MKSDFAYPDSTEGFYDFVNTAGIATHQSIDDVIGGRRAKYVMAEVLEKARGVHRNPL